LDVARNNTMKRLSSILYFVKNSEHTNLINMDAPHGFDLGASSCVNKEVNTFNKKLNKTTKPHDHTSQLNLNIQRQHFTKHGMHMNGIGKDTISGQHFTKHGMHMDGIGKDRISGLLTSRIMNDLLLLIAWGLPLPFPGRLKP
jgi:hypothetical protein